MEFNWARTNTARTLDLWVKPKTFQFYPYKSLEIQKFKISALKNVLIDVYVKFYWANIKISKASPKPKVFFFKNFLSRALKLTKSKNSKFWLWVSLKIALLDVYMEFHWARTKTRALGFWVKSNNFQSFAPKSLRIQKFKIPGLGTSWKYLDWFVCEISLS